MLYYVVSFCIVLHRNLFFYYSVLDFIIAYCMAVKRPIRYDIQMAGSKTQAKSGACGLRGLLGKHQHRPLTLTSFEASAITQATVS